MVNNVPFWCKCRRKKTPTQKKLAKGTSDVTLDGIMKGKDIQKEVNELVRWIDEMEVYEVNLKISRLKYPKEK